MTGTVAPQAVRPASQVGGADGVLTEEQVREFVHEQLAAVDLDGRSVCPTPLLLGAVHEADTMAVPRAGEDLFRLR